MRRLLLLLLLAGCGDDPASELDVEALAAPGPYGVGYRTYTVQYTPPLSTESRRLFVLVWYPSDAVDGDRPFYLLRTSEVAVENAEPKPLGPRPVLAFSHGHQAYAAAASHLMEHVASHGFVAVGVTHTGNTTVDGNSRTTEIYYQRQLDVVRSLAFLDELENDPLSGIISDRRAISGHSFGGYTTFALAGAEYPIDDLVAECDAGTGKASFCSTMTSSAADLFRAGFEDDQFQAAVAIDPFDFDLFNASGLQGVDIPVLHMEAEMGGERRYWDAIPSGVHLFFTGGGHNDFIDSCGVGVDVNCGDQDKKKAWRPTRIFTLAFLRQHLLEETEWDALFTGETEVDPLVTIERK